MKAQAAKGDRIAVRLHAGFEDAGLSAVSWREIAAQGATFTVFQEWWWQRSWWESFGRGQLLIAIVERDGVAIATAPLFIDGNMAFFVGSGGSDYLDFVGDVTGPGVLEGVLEEILRQVPELLGFRFYLVPDISPTGARLGDAASTLGLVCHDEGALPAPRLEFLTPDTATDAAAKTSMVRKERRLQREGTLSVRHLGAAEGILPHLDQFFAQHRKRWHGTASPSLFLDPDQCAFYRHLTETCAQAGALRFTVVEWNGAAIAYHFGFCHRGVFLWYKPSFDIDLAQLSPGEVLLRHLILRAAEEGADVFDFGLGDEAFKHRFANRQPMVRTWGVYPRQVPATAGTELTP